MKRFVVIAWLACLPAFALAQEAALNPAVTFTVPAATHIQIRGIDIQPLARTMTVRYRWIDATGSAVYAPGTPSQDVTFTLRDDLGEPVADCVGIGDPHGCCTEGVASGEGCREPNLEFTEVFGFKIRAQDVGNTLGKGLRRLIVTRLKQSLPVLSGATITFSD